MCAANDVKTVAAISTAGPTQQNRWTKNPKKIDFDDSSHDSKP